MPIRARDPIGAIAAYWAKRHEATSREMALLQALANASAIAIANVELVGTLVRARRSAEDARALAEAARERAASASRVQEEFLAMLGHELRNPLAPIVTALQIIAQRGKGADREHAVIAESGHLRLSAEGEDGHVVLRVEDDGIGITPELLPRLFDTFVQAVQASDRREGGLGLGLSLVRNIVALHGGSVEAQSAGPGRGSVFTMRLQRAQGTSAVPASEPAPSPTLPPRPLQVLVVDDNEDAAMMLGELLSEVGLEVKLANDGPEALALLERFTPDVALLDIGLPVMDGYELAAKMRERLGEKTPHLIAVTVYGQETDRTRGRESGFDAHLVKPVDWESLIEAIGAA